MYHPMYRSMCRLMYQSMCHQRRRRGTRMVPYRTCGRLASPTGYAVRQLESPMSKGRFVWFDLMTTHPESARAFYSALFGWTIAPHGPDGTYHMISAGAVGIGGIVPINGL